MPEKPTPAATSSASSSSLRGIGARWDLYLKGPSVISKPSPKRRDLLPYNASNSGYSQTLSNKSGEAGVAIDAILQAAEIVGGTPQQFDAFQE
jgi:hypothetical protein